MARKVYVATEGEYSDYRVRAVCSTKALAAKIGDNEPLEMEIFTTMPARATVYELTAMPWDLEPPTMRVSFPYPWDWEADHVVPRAQTHEWTFGPVRGLRAYGPTEEGVRKVFFDRRARLLAEREGLV